jgi:hypothetical protein
MGSAGVWVASEVFDAIDLKRLATTEGLAASPTPLPSEAYVLPAGAVRGARD